MDAFSTCFDFVRVPVNHRHVIRKRSRWKIPEHIVTSWCLYFPSCYFIYNARRDTDERIWYYNTNDIETRSSSEIQEKRNERKKVTFKKDMQMLQSK